MIKSNIFDDLEELFLKDNFGKAYELIKLDKRIDAEILHIKGTNYYWLQDWKRSIFYYTLAYKLSNDYFEKSIIGKNLINSYLKKGNEYYEIGKYKKAIDLYTKAIKIDPSFSWSYHNRGLTYSKLKYYNKALNDYNKEINLNPNNAASYCDRGSIQRIKKNYKKALDDIDKAIIIDPNYIYAYINRGNVYLELKEYKKALENYNKAIKINPDLGLIYYNIANIYLFQKKYTKPIKYLNKSIKLDPNFLPAYMNRGFTLLLINKELDTSIDDLKKSKDIYKGKEKDKILGYIKWAEARKYLNIKSWNNYRASINEAIEIFKSIKDPLADIFEAFIKFSYIDEELDKILKISCPIEALEKIQLVLKNLPKIKNLIKPEKTIFLARIYSFYIIGNFIECILDINEKKDIIDVRNRLKRLFEDSKKVEKDFESVNFIKGKTAIVDFQDIIMSIEVEICNINSSTNIKKYSMDILKKYWLRLSRTIFMMNGISTFETEKIILTREMQLIKDKIQSGFTETKKISTFISGRIKNIEKEQKEILDKIIETKSILLHKDVIKARFRIEVKAPLISEISPISKKIVIDIPIGKLTDKQMDGIIQKCKLLTEKGKTKLLEILNKVKLEIDTKLIKRLK